MILGVINQPTDEHFTVSDKNGNLISGIDSTAFTVHVYNPLGVDVTLSVSGTFTELGDGNYKYTFIPNINGTWYVVVTHPTYFPWGKTGDVQVYDGDLGQVYQSVLKTLGLVHHNFYIDNPVYDEHGNMVTARVRIYSNASSVGTDNDVIETYLIQADGTQCGQFSYWKQVSV
jgi:hypothetical protein